MTGAPNPSTVIGKPQGHVRVSIYDSLDRFLELGEAWNELLEAGSSDTIFLRFEWLIAWWLSMSGRRSLFVVCAWSGERLVAAAPFCIHQRAPGVRVVEFMGEGYADLAGILVRPGWDDAVELLFEELLARRGEWDLMDLGFVPADLTLERWLIRGAGEKLSVRRLRSMASPYLVVTRDWRARLSSKARGGLSYGWRRLESDTGPLDVAMATRPKEVDAALNDFYVLHQRRWVEMKHSISNYAIPNLRSAHHQLFLALARDGYAFAMTLKARGRPIAIAVNMVYKDRIYYCQPAFDPDFARYSPSRLLIAQLLDYCCSNDIRVFDFLRGDEPYKYSWTSSAVDLYRLVVWKRNVKSGLLMLWYTKWRSRLREAAFLGPALRKVRWRSRKLAQDAMSCRLG